MPLLLSSLTKKVHMPVMGHKHKALRHRSESTWRGAPPAEVLAEQTGKERGTRKGQRDAAKEGAPVKSAASQTAYSEFLMGGQSKISHQLNVTVFLLLLY